MKGGKTQVRNRTQARRYAILCATHLVVESRVEREDYARAGTSELSSASLSACLPLPHVCAGHQHRSTQVWRGVAWRGRVAGEQTGSGGRGRHHITPSIDERSKCNSNIERDIAFGMRCKLRKCGQAFVLFQILNRPTGTGRAGRRSRWQGKSYSPWSLKVSALWWLVQN